ncbi:hypothetical protein VTL71DRAFT_1733 [Oculimacula yallundae]|uniref:Uncharacterized protein n=1 Tax=Oculimacula yallundae TaxID=86028 RepID=A0ABR4CDN3_9HELO
MVFPEPHQAEAFSQFENFNDWTCPTCYKRISASRPPIYNADNCSCDDIAAYHTGYLSEPATYNHQFYNPDIASPVYNQAQSINSSSASVPCPEGPEHEDLNLQIGNAYLPLAAAPGLNELQHQQRASSSHPEMSYLLHRFLNDPQILPSETSVYDTERAACDAPAPSDANFNFKPDFLSQEIHLQSSRKTKRGSPYSKLSWVSESSSRGNISIESWGMDVLSGAGDWAGERGYANTAAYAMVLSETSDRAVFAGSDELR